MAIHARFSRWHSRGRRRLDGRMTIAAINPVITRMVHVRELYRLLPRHERLRHKRQAIEFQTPPSDPSKKYNNNSYAQPRKSVRAAGEKLRHMKTSTSLGLIFLLCPRLASLEKSDACEFSDLLRRESSLLQRKMSRPP